ncbi:MAG: hypothetical protein E7467_02535 [Ruminococcaceae bacterium]|nr:hypothetical protein [Oscillospiraceae bacterium]
MNSEFPMFGNIGQKIKALAYVMFILEAVGAIFGGIVLLSEEVTTIGLLVLFLGPVVAYLSAWMLYGFGEIIVKLKQIEENTRKTPVTTASFQATTPRYP